MVRPDGGLRVGNESRLSRGVGATEGSRNCRDGASDGAGGRLYLDERASNGMIRISTDSESWFDFSLGD